MKIRAIIPINFLILILAVIIFNYGYLNKVVLKSFIDLETQETEKIGIKLNDLLLTEISSLDSKTGDWANWDDAYNFAKGVNPKFIESNIQNTTFKELQINLILFFDIRGNILIQKTYDLQNDAPTIPTDWWLKQPLPINFDTQIEEPKNIKGIILIDEKPMMISVRKILTSKGEGPVVGLLVFGRFIDEDMLKWITTKEGNKVEMHLFSYADNNTDYKLAADELKSKTVFQHSENEYFIEAYVLMKDIFNKPTVIFRETIKRSIYEYGKNSTNLFTLFITSIIVIASLVTFIFLDRKVLVRLTRLSSEVKDIGLSDKLSVHVSDFGKDELGELAFSFNQAIDQITKVTLEKTYQERQSDSLFHVMKEAVIVTDEQNNIIFTNPSFYKFFGYTESESLGRKISDILTFYEIHGKKLSSHFLDEIVQDNQKGKGVILRIEGKGLKPAVMVTSAPIIVGNIKKGIIRVFHDVSTQIELEQQKDDFFSIASHELRTPLTVISGTIDNLLQGYGKSTLSESDKKSLSDALDSSDRLIRLVKDYLNVSRIEQGRMELRITNVNMCSLIEKIRDEMQTLFTKKGLDFIFMCDKNHALVKADEDKLKEVLINLIGNSLKFTKSGSITVRHSMRDAQLITEVIDTGMGIEQDKHHLLFSRFQQAMKLTIAREAGGSGLGLYISKELVKLMGGDMWLATSELNKGSTFAFSLPVVNES